MKFLGLSGSFQLGAVCDSLSFEEDTDPAAIPAELPGVCHGDHGAADAAGEVSKALFSCRGRVRSENTALQFTRNLI